MGNTVSETNVRKSRPTSPRGTLTSPRGKLRRTLTQDGMARDDPQVPWPQDLESSTDSFSSVTWSSSPSVSPSNSDEEPWEAAKGYYGGAAESDSGRYDPLRLGVRKRKRLPLRGWGWGRLVARC